MTERNDTSTVMPRAVRRALEAMQAGLARDIGVPELATAAGLSGRALQRQFRAFLGKTPLEALQEMRLERARRLLLRGVPGTKVMDVAARSGCLHLGRFSIAYRARYGETPSQTLKRQATFREALASRASVSTAAFEQPGLTIGPIEALPDNDKLAGDIAAELSTALMRAGVSVSSQPGWAHYHLAGAMKETGADTRIVLRLIDRETGRLLWAHRAEGPFDRASFDEHLAVRIAAAVHPALRAAEIDRAQRAPDAELSSRDMALRAMPGVLSLDADGNARALQLLNAAMRREPEHALSAALAAWAHGQRIFYYFTSTPAEDAALSGALVRRALAQRPDPTVLTIAGTALTLLRELDAAEQVIGKALAIDAGSAWASGRSGWIDAYKGRDDAAIEKFTIALELAPTDPLAFNNMVGMGSAHFNAGRYREAARWKARALIEHPSSAWIHRTLCAAHAFGDARDEARRSLDSLRATYPDLTLAKVFEGFPPLPAAYRERVREAMHDLGMPS